MATSSGSASAQTRVLLRAAVERSRRTSGPQFPIDFVRSQQDPPERPPLARLLSGGQGGEVRLKLYLTLTMLATKAPYDIREKVPSSLYAEMLGLPDPMGNGARRVADALDWLAAKKLISLGRRKGLPSTVKLLDARGGGGPYVPVKKRWIVVPVELWTQQWIVALSGSELAIWLVLREVTGGVHTPQTIATERRAQYGLSMDTWTRAGQALEARGLVALGETRERRQFELPRTRRTYWLDVERLEKPPGGRTHE